MNISPKTLAEPDLLNLRELLPKRIVIEIAEQEAVADYEQAPANRRGRRPREQTWRSSGPHEPVEERSSSVHPPKARSADSEIVAGHESATFSSAVHVRSALSSRRAEALRGHG